MTTIHKRLGISYNRLRRIKELGPEEINEALVLYNTDWRRTKHSLEMLEIIKEALDSATAPATLPSIQADIKAKGLVAPNTRVLSEILHKKLNATYRKVNAVTANHNSKRAKLMRQYASARYIQLLS